MTPQGMKPFNLQEWQNGAKPICRNGYEPTDLHYFEKAVNKIVFSKENGLFAMCTIDGIATLDIMGNYDLFLKAEKKQGWIIIHKKYTMVCAAKIYDNEEEVKKMYDKSNLTHVKIEWEQ